MLLRSPQVELNLKPDHLNFQYGGRWEQLPEITAVGLVQIKLPMGQAMQLLGVVIITW